MYDIWKGMWLDQHFVALKVFRGTNPSEKDSTVSSLPGASWESNLGLDDELTERPPAHAANESTS